MRLSVVIPAYNEEDSLPALLASLRNVLATMECEHELIFVNDGSTDGTARILRAEAKSDPRVKVLSFSRNFGHQAAITAGLDFTDGDAVVVMDADLQHPPELLPEMVRLFHEGYDVVSAQRKSRGADSIVKRATAAMFYWIMRNAVDEHLLTQSPDFRLFSREAVGAIRAFREQHRFMRGLVAWLGLNEAVVPFEQRARAAGTTKYSLMKMFRFAWTAIASFSGVPLRLSFGVGLLMTLAGLAYLCYVLYATVVAKSTVPGWSSLICVQIIFSGATLMAIGLVGDYVARLYDEAKRRPLYVVAASINLATTQAKPPRSIVLHRDVGDA